MKLFFLRHGQSVGNMTEDYSISFHGKLSDLGQRQAELMVERLKGIQFDAIIVSPLERAIQTILPYLKANNRIAEIWSELSEACYQEDRETLAPEQMRYGSPVECSDEDREFFRIRETDQGTLLPPHDKNYQEGLRRIDWVYRKILQDYKDRDSSILVVGHAHAGSRLLEMFMGMEPTSRFDHSNTGLSLLERLPSGSFMIRYINRTATDKLQP